jgi:hypothetical protein
VTCSRFAKWEFVSGFCTVWFADFSDFGRTDLSSVLVNLSTVETIDFALRNF